MQICDWVPLFALLQFIHYTVHAQIKSIIKTMTKHILELGDNDGVIKIHNDSLLSKIVPAIQILLPYFSILLCKKHSTE